MGKKRELSDGIGGLRHGSFQNVVFFPQQRFYQGAITRKWSMCFVCNRGLGPFFRSFSMDGLVGRWVVKGVHSIEPGTRWLALRKVHEEGVVAL